MAVPLPMKKSDLQEIVIISGKGGTGKTSLAASFAILADHVVVADCDVDAADLHLLLSPQVQEQHPFQSGRQAVVQTQKCIGCGICQDHCRFDALHMADSEESIRTWAVDPLSCEGCGVCVRFCPQEAIEFPERACGEWMISDTRCGPMVHARLGAAAENSGKLVSLVRQEARKIAQKESKKLIITDGPPGIGCPVIASLTGASMVVVITEPTVSGEHDLMRVLELATHFSLPAAICINKWDINPKMTQKIEEQAQKAKARLLGRIRYDPSVTQAQMQNLAVVETKSPAAQDVEAVFQKLNLKGKNS